MKRFVPYVLGGLLAITLAACGGGGTGPVTVTGVTVTPVSPSVAVGATVALSATVSPSNASQNVTWSSAAPAVATVSTSGVVTGVDEGTAVVTATSVADTTRSASVTVTVTAPGTDPDPDPDPDPGAGLVSCDETTPLSGSIDTDQVLPLQCFEVSGVVDVNAGLTIQPGTVLRFASGAGLRVRTDGTLIAAGTATNPILMTSTAGFPAPANWAGVRIESNSPANELAHVTIEYAGQTSFNLHGTSGDGPIAGLRISGGSQASVRHVTVRQSAGYGMNIGNVRLNEFSQNRFGGNERSPVSIESSAIGGLDHASDYAGEGLSEPNDDTYIRVVYNAAITGTPTWPATNLPYRFFGVHRVEGDETVVTVEPGATLEFGSAAGIRVVAGALVAEGTASDPITFTGATETPGAWAGLAFNSLDLGNSLAHVVVEYGGATSFNLHGTSSTDPTANVRVTNNARLSLTNSVLRNSNQYGLNFQDGVLMGFADNEFSGNVGAPINIVSKHLGGLDAASDYAGAGAGVPNTANYIRVVESGGITGTQTWPKTNAPYRFLNVHTVSGSETEVTIEPGAILTFGSGAGIRIDDGAGFEAIGTADDRIVFTGTTETPGGGVWAGLRFNTLNPDIELRFTEVSYGGGTSFNLHGTSSSAVAANVRVSGGAVLRFTDNVISHSGSYGMHIGGTGSATDPADPQGPAANNVFNDNAEGALNP